MDGPKGKKWQAAKTQLNFTKYFSKISTTKITIIEGSNEVASSINPSTEITSSVIFSTTGINNVNNTTSNDSLTTTSGKNIQYFLFLLLPITRDYCRMDWKALAFFSKLKPIEIAKYGTNIICASSKDTHFLKIWRAQLKN